MKARVVSLVQKVPLPIWYIAIALFAVTSYTVNRTSMMEQDAWLHVLRTGATVNFMLVLIVFSKVSDFIVKRTGCKLNSTKGLAMWLVIWLTGVLVITIILNATGQFPTIFNK